MSGKAIAIAVGAAMLLAGVIACAAMSSAAAAWDTFIRNGGVLPVALLILVGPAALVIWVLGEE